MFGQFVGQERPSTSLVAIGVVVWGYFPVLPLLPVRRRHQPLQFLEPVEDDLDARRGERGG